MHKTPFRLVFFLLVSLLFSCGIAANKTPERVSEKLVVADSSNAPYMDFTFTEAEHVQVVMSMGGLNL